MPALTEDARRRGNAVEGAGIERVCVKEVAPAERWLGPQQAYVVDRKWTLRQPPVREHEWVCGCGWGGRCRCGCMCGCSCKEVLARLPLSSAPHSLPRGLLLLTP